MWADLYDRHQEARNVGSVDVATRLRDRIKALAARDHCQDRFQGKLDYKKNPARGKAEIWVKGDTNEPMGDPIPLFGLPELENASLWIGVMLDRQLSRVDKFTVRLQGAAKPSGGPWLVSVELDEKHMGMGACGHAPIHCHVGPDHGATPEVRVPCPPMKPWEALDWVLTLVVPNWEPLPWPPGDQSAIEQAISRLGESLLENRVPSDITGARRQWLQRWRVNAKKT